MWIWSNAHKYCYVVYISFVTKNLMNFYRVKIKIWDLRFENATKIDIEKLYMVDSGQFTVVSTELFSAEEQGGLHCKIE